MKANELMIGDWVNVTQNPIKIDAVYQHTIYDIYGNNYSDEDISYIQLTEEILKANGFHKLKIDFVLYPDDSDSEYFVNFCDGCFGIKIMESYIEINYVHELQHALRLCGLNELADYFKI